MLRRCAVLSAFALLPTMAFASTESTPARPLGSPGQWVMPEDYPSAALRSGAAGTTGFRLTVTTDGGVGDCTITESSGSADLDSRACEVLTRRARFEPARDEDGQPIAATYSSRVRWQIPEGVPDGVTVFAHNIQIEFDVAPDGSIENCQAKGMPDGLPIQSWCAQNHKAVFVDPGEAEKGRLGRRHVIMREGMMIQDALAEKAAK